MISNQEIQDVLNEILESKLYKSVVDLNYYPPEEVILVRRKMGYRPMWIPISRAIREPDPKIAVRREVARHLEGGKFDARLYTPAVS